MNNYNSKKKVFIIGLDGATFDLIKPWAELGKLPTISKLMSKGNYGELASTIPPVTAPAWSSIFTGTNPGKHGLFDFTKHKVNSYSRELVSSRDIQIPTFPELLSKQGYRTGLVNVPMTYPPKPLNGFVISGMLAPDEECEFIFPRDLKPKLFQNIGGYRIDYNIMGYSNEDEMLRNLNDVTELRKKAIRYLLTTEEWDLFYCVFVGIDRVQHWVWDVLGDPIDFSKDNIILEFYKIIDNTIQELISIVPEDTAVILVSDHGFGPTYKKIMFNRWLYQEGFLSLIKGKSTTSLIRKLKGIYKHKGAGHQDKIEEPEHFFERWKGWKNYSLAQINWSDTKAFAGNETEMGIYINTEGRFPAGIVKDSEYENLREDIIQRLLKLTDSENGKRVIQKAYRREDIYSGDYMQKAPDIVFETSNYEYDCSEDVNDPSGPVFLPLQKSVMGKHRRNGIFIANGLDIKAGQITGAGVYDIAPTILYMMGVPIPDYMEGRVLEEIFVEEYKKSRIIQRESWTKENKLENNEEQIYTDEDKDKIVEKLKGLGYLDSL
ncbi:MAG: alkaline phosphatase family protein [Nitrospirae bacterium]|nr:alkaline phosphatase family protein [Nitrospirota bacterium]